MGGAAAGLREVLLGGDGFDGRCVLSRVCVCCVGWFWEIVEKCWPEGRGKGRRKIRV